MIGYNIIIAFNGLSGKDISFRNLYVIGFTDTSKVYEFQLVEKETEILKLQLSKVFKALNEENRKAVSVIKTNISKKESDIEQVEYNYALATDTKKQAIIEKTLSKLQSEKAEIEAELEKVSKEILNLDDFIDFSLNLRSNLFKMWDVADLCDKRRLQNLVFPEGIIFNKETGHIEPLGVNRMFIVTDGKSGENKEKENGQTDNYINLSAKAPLQGLEPWTP